VVTLSLQLSKSNAMSVQQATFGSAVIYNNWRRSR